MEGEFVIEHTLQTLSTKYKHKKIKNFCQKYKREIKIMPTADRREKRNSISK